MPRARSSSGKRTAARPRGAALRKKLPEYEARRDFAVTPEPPPGAVVPHPEPTFVVHKHDATRLHYDVRLEMDGALASWSVPKGPSYDPAIKRLAIQTEDHPLEYGSFEGRIPDGEYGAGDSLIWDNGTCDSVPPGKLSEHRKKGHIVVEFHGKKLQGQWHLVRTHGDAPGKAQWLMFKAKDGKENPAYDVVAERPESVVSGRVATRGPERSGKLRAPRAAPDAILRGYLPPMLATLVDAAPAGDWHAEVKYDGYRALCALSNGRVAMWTRNALDLSERFPRIARALARIVVGDAVIDGEVCVLDPQGVPRFELIQQGRVDEAVLFAFDLLRLDGEDLRGRPLEERRDLLRSVLSNAPPEVRLAEEVPGDVNEALERMRERGLEGLILKARRSVYEKGRSREWLKLKAQATQELAIVGWTPGKGNASGSLGALLLAVADGKGGYEFAGKVGTGFSSKQRRELQKQLAGDERQTSPARGAPRLRDAHWVEPRLVAQVRFTEWTHDGKLRHPAFQGLRADKKPEECIREKPAPVPEAPKRKIDAPRKVPPPAAQPEQKLTNPDRLLYPKDRITKADVAAYYEAVSPVLLAAVEDRPLTLVHWNQGIEKASWFQQDVGAMAEDWMHTVETPARTKKGAVRHLVVDSPRALRWLAQNSVLEIHAWHSRAQSLTQPDWVVFDLDPAEGETIEQAVEVAQVLHGMFERLGLPSIPKTTGKRGLHIFVPLAKGHTYEDAESFALQVGDTVARQLKNVTLERSLAARRGRLYFDCMQNAYGKTVVAAYSLRGVAGAAVSTPLLWSEVKPGLDPKQFNLRTMPSRLREMGDLFAPALTQGLRLPRYKR
ncbi:MAG: DNA ligase D [Deltaproteobacteria bacterium]|nr:MAG: DNA ligase D [Deltaproteobacteria bacterium]